MYSGISKYLILTATSDAVQRSTVVRIDNSTKQWPTTYYCVKATLQPVLRVGFDKSGLASRICIWF